MTGAPRTTGLDAEIAAVLDAAARMRTRPFWQMTPDEVRAAVAAAPTRPRPLGVDVVDSACPGPAGEIRLRVYRPSGLDPRPGIVFFHGSGWVICSLDTHDDVAAELCAASGCVVVSVDYRLAPEAKFPCALDDCDAATTWVADHRGDFGIEGRLAVCGDSAGGNLAAALCVLARDRGNPKIDFQLLVYPVLDTAFDTPSYDENGAYGLSREQMQWFRGHYLSPDDDVTDARVAPLRTPNLDGLPPARLVISGFDVLRDEAYAYAERLRAAGTPVEIQEEPTATHGFWNLPVALTTTSIAAAARATAAALENEV